MTPLARACTRRPVAGAGADGHLQLCAGPAEPAQLHLQVQGDGGRGAAAAGLPGVPQRLPARRRVQEVSTRAELPAQWALQRSDARFRGEGVSLD